MSLIIAKNKEAEQLLNKPEFQKKWKDLFDQCPWATVFQGNSYLKIWNRNYKDVCELILIYELDQSGDLKGLFPLSFCNMTGKLFIAGNYHSEYQTWLSTKKYGNEFAAKAFDLLKNEFPKNKLQLMFLAPNTPLDWLKGKWSGQSVLQTVPRPLVDLSDKEKSAKSLRKRGNKTRIRQLKKQGDLQFIELKSPKEFANIFDEIEDFSRLRLSGIHNVQPEIDSRRKQFHLDLMNETDIVRPSLLKVDNEIASAQVCFKNRDEMLLSITAMSPFYAKQSPSKIHLLMLGDALTKTNYKNFDLSPGNGYKQRFATKTEESHTLTVFFNKTEFTRYKTKRRAIALGQKSLERLKITKSTAFKFGDKLCHKLKRTKLRTIPATLLKRMKRMIYESKECRIYSINVDEIKSLSEQSAINRNSILDLLKYQPVEARQDTTSQFHQKVLSNFEQGIHSYSYTEEDTLLHYGWLLERQKVSHVFEVDQKFRLLPNSAVLFDYYTHPKARGRGLYQKAILQGLHDAKKIPGTERIYIGVMADNGPSRHVIEKLGFNYQGSLFKEVKLGITKKWQSWNNETQINQNELQLQENYSI